MFNGAILFDQDLSSWNMSNKPTIIGMFVESGLSQTNNDAIYNAWVDTGTGPYSESELLEAGLTTP